MSIILQVVLELTKCMVTFIQVCLGIDNHTANFSVLVVHITVNSLLVFDVTFQCVAQIDLGLKLILVILFKVANAFFVASSSGLEFGNPGSEDIIITSEVPMLFDLVLVRPNY
jgi:hypothetical protein